MYATINRQSKGTKNLLLLEIMTEQTVVFEHENKQVIKEGNFFFLRVFENGENFESGDFNTIERAIKHLGIAPKKELKIPKTIKTDERIFKIQTFDDDKFLCNVDISKQYLQADNIKKLWHLWDFEFKSFSKKELKNI